MGSMDDVKLCFLCLHLGHELVHPQTDITAVTVSGCNLRQQC